MVEDSLYFEVDSQLLGELGERLVSKNYIALSELIKNAYDADATVVKVTLSNVKRHGKDGFITIEDNGSGMTFANVQNYWMKIATPNKRVNPRSNIFGRFKTGDKGVGRFACRRLGRKLLMECIGKLPNNKYELTRVDFDWDKYKPGTNLRDIQNVYVRKNISQGQTGVKLHLSNISESWSQRDFDVLRRYLVSYSILKGIRREGYKEDPSFIIKFNAPEFNLGSGSLSEQFMNSGWGRLDGLISKDSIKLVLKAKEIGLVEFELPVKTTQLDGVSISAAIIPLDSKEYWRDKSTLSLGIARELSYEAGIKVYFKGFRVYPYGEPDDDWLGIDRDVAKRKGAADEIFRDISNSLVGVEHGRVLLHHPSTRNLFGHVNIDGKAVDSFEVKINREGFIKNENFDSLVKIIRLCLEWSTLHYANFIYKYKQKKLREEEKQLRRELRKIKGEKEQFLKIDSTPNGIDVNTSIELKKDTRKDLTTKALGILEKESIRSLDLIDIKDKQETEKRIRFAKDYLEASFQLTEEEIDHLRTVASTGALIQAYSHEIRDLVHRLDRHSKTINRLIKRVPDSEISDFQELAKSLLKTKNRFLQQLKLFGLLAKGTKEEKIDIVLQDATQDIVDGFSFLTEYFGIKIDITQINEGILVGPIYEAELYSILINLISNAVKATISGQGEKIEIKANNRKREVIITISNEGVMLAEKYWLKVFEPWYADPESKLYSDLAERMNNDELTALGKGSGLGLSIVKGIIEKNGGSIRFIKPIPPFQTSVEVILK